MAVGERQTQKQRRKTPSFSSSLLDAIYHSIDEPGAMNEQQQPQVAGDYLLHRRINGPQVEEEIESLRRAIMIEKWMENYSTTTTTTTARHLPSNSDSSTDSSMFSSSEPESSASRSTKRSSSLFPNQKPKYDQATPQNQGRFTRTKSRAMKIYGDLKKVKEPISPGGKIANFLNSIFSPRNNLKKNQGLEEWSSVRKSRSMKDNAMSASRSCLSKNPSSSGGTNNNNKSKRSVRFCPVSVILDEDSRPCGHKRLYEDEYSVIGSQFIKKNIDSFRLFEGKKKNVIRKHGLMREFYDNESDVDDKSCASSDLFELENIGPMGIGAYHEELPVYGTTSIKLNQAIARGYVM